MCWNFDGAELDLLAKAITGKKVKIAPEVVQTFVQGLIESIIVSQLQSDVDHRTYMIASLRNAGKSEEYIHSYLRGWDAVGNSVLENADDQLAQIETDDETRTRPVLRPNRQQTGLRIPRLLRPTVAST